ncbi:GntR family transcriptional regulator [Alloalcanivorax xenomutans]|uniref:GntR family transcriptional regulator n=1 Tax=Alloalcanivorax xenomutans TaxID=1094342 RepID=UPI003D9B4EAF
MTLRAVSLSEQIADHLAEQIVRGERKPGEKLPEAELAKQLEVSTNSLREAFRLLEKQHLIELQPRRGARVCEVSESEVRDLYDFLFLLLSRLAAQAASNWQPGQIEDLAAMLPDFQRCYDQDDVQGGHQLAFRFVEIATDRFANNRYLAADITDLMPLLKRFSFIALQEETTEFDVSLRIFQRLLENVLARDPEKAAADIREYGENQCRIVLRAVAKREL